MEIPKDWVTCDGCGLPASPAHIAERLSRLELATRYRPIHVSVLFVAAAPMSRPEDDFYGPPVSSDFFDPLMEALEIPNSIGNTPAEEGEVDTRVAMLLEFQRRGCYLSYLSECPASGEEEDTPDQAIFRLAPALVRRVRFNYKPKQIVILGGGLPGLKEILVNAGIAATSVSVLEFPLNGDDAAKSNFRAALPTV